MSLATAPCYYTRQKVFSSEGHLTEYFPRVILFSESSTLCVRQDAWPKANSDGYVLYPVLRSRQENTPANRNRTLLLRFPGSFAPAVRAGEDGNKHTGYWIRSSPCVSSPSC
jgi:hypothetical protein